MVTKAEVQKVADLAKLEFAPSELELLTGELNSILGYIDQLKELDVTNIAPLENLNEAFEHGSPGLRADVERECLPVEDALRNAPKAADGYFLVPKVLATEVKTPVKRAFSDKEDDELL